MPNALHIVVCLTNPPVCNSSFSDFMVKTMDIRNLRIPVDTIGKAGIERDVVLSPEEFESVLDDEDLKVQVPLEIHYTITRKEDVMHASVHVKGEILTYCSRCLSPMVYSIDRHLESDYMRAGPGMNEDLEEARSNPELGYYRKEIFLGEYIMSELILDLPARFLCDPECKGLCPYCGANLNKGPCSCSGEVEPRLRVMKKLLDRR